MPQQQQALETNRSFTPYVLFAMAIIYALSPVDIIPDIPVIGWVDDTFILMATGLNVLEKGIGIKSRALISTLRLFKWLVIILGIIATALLALAGIAIYKLISG